MKNILPFFFALITLGAHAQSHSVEWGELERVKGRLLYMLPADSNEFYALRWTGGRLFGRYKLSRHENLVNSSSGNANMVAEKSVGNFEGARIIGGKLVTFLSDKRDYKNNFFMQVYNKELDKEGEPVKLASYDLDKGMKKGWFGIRISSNEKFFGVVWVIPGKKDNRDKYGFKIFDVELNVINEGEYPLPFDPKLSTINEHHISDNGEYFFSGNGI